MEALTFERNAGRCDTFTDISVEVMHECFMTAAEYSQATLSFALFGSSGHISVGADSTITPIFAADLRF
jgi:hypothetical protein